MVKLFVSIGKVRRGTPEKVSAGGRVTGGKFLEFPSPHNKKRPEPYWPRAFSYQQIIHWLLVTFRLLSLNRCPHFVINEHRITRVV